MSGLEQVSGASGSPGPATPLEAPALDGAAPATGAAPLTPQQRAAATRAENKRKAAERKAARAAKAAPKKKPDATQADAPAGEVEQLDPDRTDKERRADAARFWRLVFRLVAFLGSPWWTFAALKPEEALEDAEYLVPLARRHRWFDVTIRWASLPLVLIDRIAAKATRKPAPKKEPAK